MLRKASFDLTADATGADTLTRALPGRSPYIVYRIDIDDSAALGVGSSAVEDEDLNALAADDPRTDLFSYGDVTDAEYQGQLIAGPVTFDITGWDPDDVITFEVFYDSAGMRD